MTYFPIEIRLPDGSTTWVDDPELLPEGVPFTIISTNDPNEDSNESKEDKEG